MYTTLSKILPFSLTLFLLTGSANCQQTSDPQSETFNHPSNDRVQVEETVVFTPPKGWMQADPNILPKHVKAMVVGTGLKEFPPSINLGMEEFGGTLQDYLKIVKDINHSEGSEWKDLGSIRTQAGQASLSQADATTKWGSVRMMHVILLRDGMIYILTAAALKDEFPQYYKTFFESLRSLRMSEAPIDNKEENTI